jgi:hypothetical protein
MNDSFFSPSGLRRVGVSPRDNFAGSAILWFAIVGAGSGVVWYWCFSHGAGSANAKLVATKAAALISVAALVFWYARGKDREISRLRALIPAEAEVAETEEWSSADEDLLAALWHHPGIHSDTFACYLTDRDAKLIGYQLERLERANLVASTIAGYLRLTAEGRDYVVRHSLAARSGSLLFESAPLARGRQAAHYRKREIYQQGDEPRIQPTNWIPMSEDQVAGQPDTRDQSGENPEGRHSAPA